MNDFEKVKNSYCLMYDAMTNKDSKLLAEILCDNFVLVHMTGMNQSKKEFINSVLNGTLNYFSAKHQNIKVNIHNSTAELIGQSIVNAAVFGGGRHTWKLQLDLDLIKKDEEWLIYRAKASVY